MRKHSVHGLVTLTLVMLSLLLTMPGQISAQVAPLVEFTPKGIVFMSADSMNKAVMRFRMQNWATYVTKSESDLEAALTDIAVRRLRLQFTGHLFDPRLAYKIELGFTRSDISFAEQQDPNLILDAMVYWNFSPDLQVSFGQTKLPGNRQRVISSGEMEYADRTVVNGAFNIDRDPGIQAFWRPVTGPVILNLRGAISLGEGRNQAAVSNGGLAYTGRVELLPLGAFTSGGDYYEGDLAREKSPRISLGLTANYNDSMMRTRGELGKALYQGRSATVLYADGLLKWSGLALYAEWASRAADDPITYSSSDSSKTAAVYVGDGYMAQLSYTFPFMLSFGARYAMIDADEQLAGRSEYVKDENMAGMATYYIRGHRIKAQIEVGSNTRTDHNKLDAKTTNLYTRLNFELGI